MKNILITWGFHPLNGHIYLDCYTEIKSGSDAETARMMSLRSKSQDTHLSLLRVPEDWDREDMQLYIVHSTPDNIKTLVKAKVQPNEIFRKRHSESNAIDFIKC